MNIFENPDVSNSEKTPEKERGGPKGDEGLGTLDNPGQGKRVVLI